MIYEEDDHQDQQLGGELRKGPWTVEEDSLLSNYVSLHGEGRWNSLARHAGLKRTGKSCRLRWLNYLRPSVRRGNITLQEQLLILELHSSYGNRWSKIAQYLPGRTDNEVKNYWRTRVQKQAKQLKCDVNSKQFQDAMRYVWIPRLIERIQATRSDPSPPPHPPPNTTTTTTAAASADFCLDDNDVNYEVAPWGSGWVDPNFMPDMSGTSSDTSDAQVSSVSDLTECGNPTDCIGGVENMSASTSWQYGSELQGNGQSDQIGLLSGGDSLENWWSEEDLRFFQHQLCDEQVF
ncbi:hypothetical protein TIFTF001_047824 [Ficus carica]|uniref:Uncharacterized protein n=1 Tax=Ficus carica TaxID=3494 RepID=A0AA87Z722_FICCA|nr:hypothetical protein TIFTF001_047824 [Ficus carica]